MQTTSEDSPTKKQAQEKITSQEVWRKVLINAAIHALLMAVSISLLVYWQPILSEKFNHVKGMVPTDLQFFHDLGKFVSHAILLFAVELVAFFCIDAILYRWCLQTGKRRLAATWSIGVSLALVAFFMHSLYISYWASKYVAQ